MKGDYISLTDMVRKERRERAKTQCLCSFRRFSIPQPIKTSLYGREKFCYFLL